MQNRDLQPDGSWKDIDVTRARITPVCSGNAILDVHGLSIDDPAGLEGEINQITGVVTNGLFARRPAADSV